MFSLRFLIIGFLLFQSFAQLGNAESEQIDFMRSFQSERILFPEEGSDYTRGSPGQDPAWMHWFFEDLMSWNPNGKPAFYTNPCQPKVWAAKMIGKKVKAQAQVMNEYLKKCASELETGVNNSWIHTLKIMSVRQYFNQHPLMHRVVFQLPNGDKIKGRLALKGDLKKRPLVILRLGVFGNIEDFKDRKSVV